MADNSTERPLTDKSLARLRKLAEGNGLAPNDIELIESVEKVYNIEGLLQLVPFCERHGGKYAGAPAPDRVRVVDAAALAEAAERHQQAFLNGRDWLPEVMKELESAPGQGWGLDGAKITVPSKSKIFATTEMCGTCHGNKAFVCNQCQGQGAITCAQCEGRGYELCYNCSGRGVNPAHPDKPCVICHGKRYAPCRFCTSTGKLVCPQCQGRRNVVCPRCNGVGQFSQEIALACGATVNFSLKGQDWPSGMRRGIDRLGIANLIKGHADVRAIPREPDKETPEGPPDPKKAAEPIIFRYEASLPYADLKLRFGKNARAGLVSVFGKKAAMMGVPPFLDQSLQSARENLKKAGRGAVPLDKALETRAMRDALALVIGGRGKAENLRRLYPVGLSPKTAQEILQNMRRALNQHTLKIRAAAAAGICVVGALLLAGFALLPLHAQLMQGKSAGASLLIDLIPLAAVMGIGWAGLGYAIQYMLKKSFPKLTISMHSNAGHIGYGMLAGLFAAWLIILVSIPEKSPWILQIFGNLGR